MRIDETRALADLVATLVGLLEGPAAEFTEDDVEGLLRAIDGAASDAAPSERDAALRSLGAALHADDLDEVSEALLIAACGGPIATGGNPAPVAEAIVSFACVTLPVCCSYFLLMVAASGEGESAAEAMHALVPLQQRFPQAGFEITAVQWTAKTLQALIRGSSGAAAELGESIFVIPSLYALAPLLPEARELLRVLDPALAGARRPASSPPAGDRARGTGTASHTRGADRPRETKGGGRRHRS